MWCLEKISCRSSCLGKQQQRRDSLLSFWKRAQGAPGRSGSDGGVCFEKTQFVKLTPWIFPWRGELVSFHLVNNTSEIWHSHNGILHVLCGVLLAQNWCLQKWQFCLWHSWQAVHPLTSLHSFCEIHKELSPLVSRCDQCSQVSLLLDNLADQVHSVISIFHGLQSQAISYIDCSSYPFAPTYCNLHSSYKHPIHCMWYCHRHRPWINIADCYRLAMSFPMAPLDPVWFSVQFALWDAYQVLNSSELSPNCSFFNKHSIQIFEAKPKSSICLVSIEIRKPTTKFTVNLHFDQVPSKETAISRTSPSVISGFCFWWSLWTCSLALVCSSSTVSLWAW